MEELGIPQQWAIFNQVADKTGKAPPVIDSARTLRQPELVLRALCDRLQIGFSQQMLSWPAGRRHSDGVWASHWYTSVEKSTRFEARAEQPLAEVEIPAQYETMCEQAQVIYVKLLQHSLI